MQRTPGTEYQSLLLKIVSYIKDKPQCQDWMRYMRLEEEGADRVLAKILLSTMEDMTQFSGKTLDEVVHRITRGDDAALYGICDKYHVAHEEMLKWITMWINIPEPKDKDPKKRKAWQQMNNILDYYGKTGQFALQVAKRTKCNVTFIDQDPWFPYAKFRFRKHRTHFKTRSIQADPANPRPVGEYDKFGFISSLEVPIVNMDTQNKPLPATQDWVEWFEAHTIPLGFVATCALLPWKKVAALNGIGFIYQFIPA